MSRKVDQMEGMVDEEAILYWKAINNYGPYCIYAIKNMLLLVMERLELAAGNQVLREETKFCKYH
jgi:hypothetical protein